MRDRPSPGADFPQNEPERTLPVTVTIQGFPISGVTYPTLTTTSVANVTLVSVTQPPPPGDWWW